MVSIQREDLMKVPLFVLGGPQDAFLDEITGALRPRCIEDGSLAVTKGEVGTEMFFVAAGVLQIEIDGGKVVGSLKAGDFFGEVSMLYSTERIASIRAQGKAEIYVLSHADFKTLLEKFPAQRELVASEGKKRFAEKDG